MSTASNAQIDTTINLDSNTNMLLAIEQMESIIAAKGDTLESGERERFEKWKKIWTMKNYPMMIKMIDVSHASLLLPALL